MTAADYHIVGAAREEYRGFAHIVRAADIKATVIKALTADCQTHGIYLPAVGHRQCVVVAVNVYVRIGDKSARTHHYHVVGIGGVAGTNDQAIQAEIPRCFLAGSIRARHQRTVETAVSTHETHVGTGKTVGTVEDLPTIGDDQMVAGRCGGSADLNLPGIIPAIVGHNQCAAVDDQHVVRRTVGTDLQEQRIRRKAVGRNGQPTDGV